MSYLMIYVISPPSQSFITFYIHYFIYILLQFITRSLSKKAGLFAKMTLNDFFFHPAKKIISAAVMNFMTDSHKLTNKDYELDFHSFQTQISSVYIINCNLVQRYTL